MDMRPDLDRHLSVDYHRPGFEVPCDGSSACVAPVHEHGCYADLNGSCNYPGEHEGAQ